MTDGVILGVAVLAGLACPVHMWWTHRRGRHAACCPPGGTGAGSDIDALHARQERLSALVAQYEAVSGRPADDAQATGSPTA